MLLAAMETVARAASFKGRGANATRWIVRVSYRGPLNEQKDKAIVKRVGRRFDVGGFDDVNGRRLLDFPFAHKDEAQGAADALRRAPRPGRISVRLFYNR